MLGSYRRDRDAGKEYAKGVSKTFDDLILSYPGIPPHIQKQYSLRIAKLEKEGEKIADTDVIEKIQIIKETDDKQAQSLRIGKNETTPTPPPDIRINISSDDNGDNGDSELLDSISLRGTRRKSINEIDVSDIIMGDTEKPFDNERAKYELQRFLQAKEI